MRTEEIRKDLETLLSPSRFQHSVGVAESAKALAQHYSIDGEKAYLAGLIHDCAKELSRPVQLVYAMRAEWGFDLSQLPFPFLYHGPAGSVFARHRFGIEDPDILKAVSLHILGMPDMSMLEKIVFVSDYMEPNRRFHWREEIEKAAFQSLEEAMVLGCKITTDYLTSSGARIHPNMLSTRDFYENLRRNELAGLFIRTSEESGKHSSR